MQRELLNLIDETFKLPSCEERPNSQPYSHRLHASIDGVDFICLKAAGEGIPDTVIVIFPYLGDDRLQNVVLAIMELEQYSIYQLQGAAINLLQLKLPAPEGELETFLARFPSLTVTSEDYAQEGEIFLLVSRIKEERPSEAEIRLGIALKSDKAEWYQYVSFAFSRKGNKRRS